MRKFLWVMVFACWSLQMFGTRPSFAHTMEETGTVESTLHITPLHEPIAGTNSIIEILFTDSAHKFKVQNCTCAILIKLNKKVLDTISIKPEDIDVSTQTIHVPYVFKNPGDYEIELSAKPQISGQFPSFDTEFPTTVTGTVKTTLNVTPRSEPYADKKSVITFSFSDSAHKFKVQNCDCSVTIKIGDRVFGTIKIQPKNTNEADQTISVPYVFPGAGDYDIVLSAKPDFPNQFLAFNASFITSVTIPFTSPLSSQTKKPSNFEIWQLIFGIMTAAGAGIIVYSLLPHTHKK